MEGLSVLASGNATPLSVTVGIVSGAVSGAAAVASPVLGSGVAALADVVSQIGAGKSFSEINVTSVILSAALAFGGGTAVGQLERVIESRFAKALATALGGEALVPFSLVPSVVGDLLPFRIALQAPPALAGRK